MDFILDGFLCIMWPVMVFRQSSSVKGKRENIICELRYYQIAGHFGVERISIVLATL